MSRSNLLSLIIEDFRAHGSDWTRPGFRTLAVYRFGVWRTGIANRHLRALLWLIYRTAYRFCRNIYGIELPYTATVGRGVVIEHQGGIVIHGSSIIGDHCIVRQNCTLGIRTLEALSDAPILMKGVSLGAGAVVLGRVTIGEYAMVGANAVVLHDVPARAVVVGVPAQIVRTGPIEMPDHRHGTL
jgi:serine O-acetyltransferase